MVINIAVNCENDLYLIKLDKTYQPHIRLGEGTYGTVFKGIDKNTKTIVALKRVILHNEKTDGFPITSLREITILQSIHHPNVVKLIEVVVSSQRDGVYLVFEYAEHDLAYIVDHIRNPFSLSEIKSLCYQLISAIAHLHKHYIIHRDIKLPNLLYNRAGEIKLADFGMARQYCSPARKMTLKVVSLWYRAPELLLMGEVYTQAVDMW